MRYKKMCYFELFPLFKGPGRAHMGPYGPIWAHMRPYEPLWAHMDPKNLQRYVKKSPV